MRPPALTHVVLALLFVSACSTHLAGTDTSRDPVSAGDGDDESDHESDGEPTSDDDGADATGDVGGDDVNVDESPTDGDASDATADDDGDGDGHQGSPCAKSGRRCLPEEVLALRGIAYSGYRQGQRPGGAVPNEQQIGEDLALLVRAGFGLLRTFDADTHAERVLRVIATNQLSLRVQLGVWIAGSAALYDEANQAELARAIELANLYPDIVVSLSVGNNTLDAWSSEHTPVDDLAGYISQVRDHVAQPVGTDNTYVPFLLGQHAFADYRDVVRIFDVADFLGVHVHPFVDAAWDVWDWQLLSVSSKDRARAMMDNALAYTKDAVADVRRTSLAYSRYIPVLVSETGWKDRTTRPADAASLEIEPYLAHAVNQRWMADDLESWVHGADHDAHSPEGLFYFEAFDEPWKGDDDHWGLFDVKRHAKYAVWARVPELRPADAVEPDPAGAARFDP
jgi:exo-beta-1,3-glucanase (GH17 family)